MRRVGVSDIRVNYLRHLRLNLYLKCNYSRDSSAV